MQPREDLATLVTLLQDKSFRTGDFTLSSGRKSTYYIDARPTTMSAAGLNVIGRLGLREIVSAGWRARFVGGLTLGADPVAYAIAGASLGTDNQMDAFTVRKASKAYGAGRRIEGSFEEGSRVIIVEDVITTGASALNAAGVVQQSGAQVEGVLAVVDRLEGGREAIEGAGHPVRVLVTVDDLRADPTGS